MNHLLREHAPITDAAWKEIDDEGRQQLVALLAARKLVEFVGPLGWDHSAKNLGRTVELTASPTDGLSSKQRRVLPLVELRAGFSVDREDILAADRGASDIDLVELGEASRRIARAENIAVFHGWDAAGIVGISEASPHTPITLAGDYASYPSAVARGVKELLDAGVQGPYGLALGPDEYTGVVETTEHGGVLVFDHLREILGGPIVWAPGVEGAVVVSQRGGDFEFESGEDIAIGYSHHDAERVYLYVEESFTFHATSPEAGIALRSKESKK
jgi:uncharacterized linocin/CFP29 family protein